MQLTVTILFSAAIVSACANLAADPAKMTPEQLKAAAKDKNASGACATGKNMAGTFTTVYVNADQGSNIGSRVTINGGDCTTIVETVSKAASAP